MAYTDACKIQVTQFVKKCTDEGMSVNQACKATEKESDGIPAETIRHWWKEAQKEVGEFSPTELSADEEEVDEKATRLQSQRTVWKRTAKKLKKLSEYMMKNCESPADIDAGVKMDVLDYVKTINFICDDL